MLAIPYPNPLPPIIDPQTRKVVIFVVNSGELDDLACAILVERKAAARVHDLALFIFASTKDQATVLSSFVVVKDHARLRSRLAHLRMLLALDNDVRQTGFVRDHHPKSAVRLSYVNAVHSNFVEILLLRPSGTESEHCRLSKRQKDWPDHDYDPSLSSALLSRAWRWVRCR
jgi:hypothetical protein